MVWPGGNVLDVDLVLAWGLVDEGNDDRSRRAIFVSDA
jgi:hypothetical protein